jgi:hypothetical protein
MHEFYIPWYRAKQTYDFLKTKTPFLVPWWVKCVVFYKEGRRACFLFQFPHPLSAHTQLSLRLVPVHITNSIIDNVRLFSHCTLLHHFRGSLSLKSQRRKHYLQISSGACSSEGPNSQKLYSCRSSLNICSGNLHCFYSKDVWSGEKDCFYGYYCGAFNCFDLFSTRLLRVVNFPLLIL